MIVDKDKEAIAETLTQEVGEPVKIELVALETVPQPTETEDAAKEATRKTPLMRKLEAQDDPQLKTALELFEATVVETQ